MSESCGFTSSLNKLLIQGQKTEELYQNKDILRHKNLHLCIY